MYIRSQGRNCLRVPPELIYNILLKYSRGSCVSVLYIEFSDHIPDQETVYLKYFVVLLSNYQKSDILPQVSPPPIPFTLIRIIFQ